MPSALIFYQYFHPDDVVSAVLLTELAKGLVSRGWDVTAMPCNRDFRNRVTYPRSDSHSGVTIKRIWRPAFSQNKSFGRIANCVWMLVAWSLLSLIKRPDVLIIGTDPVLSAVVAIPWKLLCPSIPTIHWCFDLYPEAAVAEGILKPSFTLRFAQRLMASAYKHFNLITDIGDCMRHRLAAYSTPAVLGRLRPWALAEPLTLPDLDPIHRKTVFGDAKLAILYSGSFGRAHSFTEVLTIARALRDVSAHFSFGIRGNRAAEVHNAMTLADHNISFAPFVPVDQLEARLSAADIHVVSLRPEWTGTVVPSKFFGALAAGRPVLFTGSEDCSIARLIRHHGLGWVCPPGSELEVAEQLRGIANDPLSLLALKKHCHEVYSQNFSREIAIEGFDQDLRKLIPRPYSPMFNAG